MCLQIIYIYIYTRIYEFDLDNLQWLIYHKPNKTKSYIFKIYV